jgi:hypothetical protein
MEKRHPKLMKLTAHLTQDEFAEWIRMYSVESFEDSEKRYFSPEDISEFEHESSANGREYNKLSDLKKHLGELITKGIEEDFTFTIKATVGTKLLDAQRRQNDDLIEKGFEEIEIEVFGIVNQEDETMEFFDIEGKLITERTRSLTPKEKHKHLGMFQMKQNLKKVGNDIVDEDSGEVLKTGTED